MCLVRDSASMETCERDEHGARDGSVFIEVVVISSLKESIIDSFLDSSFRSLPLRFWSISWNSSGDLALQQRLNHEGPYSISFMFLLSTCNRYPQSPTISALT